MQTAALLAAAILIGLGIYGLLSGRDLIRLCLGISIMETGMLIAFAAIAFRPGASAPIIYQAVEAYVDPLPHALTLTAIVIGAGITAVMLSLAVMIHSHYGTIDIKVLDDDMPELKSSNRG